MYCILMFYNDSQATENDLEPKKKKKLMQMINMVSTIGVRTHLIPE